MKIYLKQHSWLTNGKCRLIQIDVNLIRKLTPSMKPILTWWEGLSNEKLSPSASTRWARRSDSTTFEQNKRTFLMLIPRTWFNVEELRLASYFISLFILFILLAYLFLSYFISFFYLLIFSSHFRWNRLISYIKTHTKTESLITMFVLANSF